ncbi:MAG TPA: hypothetical protein HPP87_10185 [Planctomycetes bacterium]|nr:hypothetical protein [Planctomycetota bacterium]
MEEELRLKESDCDKETFVTDDLKFIRDMLERTHREIDPEAFSMIIWGLVSMVIYFGAYFFVVYKIFNWIPYVLFPSLAVGGIVGGFSSYRVSKRQKARGMVSHIWKQLNWVWFILLPNAVIWSILGLFQDYFGGPGFLWAAVYAIALSMTGILYSREWLFGGISIFIAIIVAFFVRPYSYLILGAVMGLACIIPAIIAHRRYKRSEAEYAQG